MTGFKPRTSGIGSDRSTNWATQPLPYVIAKTLICEIATHSFPCYFGQILAWTPIKVRLLFNFSRFQIDVMSYQRLLHIHFDLKHVLTKYLNIVGSIFLFDLVWFSVLRHHWCELDQCLLKNKKRLRIRNTKKSRTWLIWCDFRVREISRRREKWKIKCCQTRKIANHFKNFPNLPSEKVKRKMH